MLKKKVVLMIGVHLQRLNKLFKFISFKDLKRIKHKKNVHIPNYAVIVFLPHQLAESFELDLEDIVLLTQCSNGQAMLFYLIALLEHIVWYDYRLTISKG
jgi:hypothetical protein